MARDGEEEVVVEGGQVGELLDEEFGNGLSAAALPGNTVLGSFG